ncbi:MAG TPA: hypothetical protein VFW68_14900, partial [Rhodocyclaceae bacterium]|nr:hypothetical protein [Rhodocyclaceae bacterium]
CADHQISSFRRKPESRGSCGHFWIPAFAGMTRSLRFRPCDIYSGQQCAFAGMTSFVWQAIKSNAIVVSSLFHT